MKEIIIEEKLLGGVYAQEVRGELIRCKDCKHYKPYTGRVSGNMFHECEHFDRDIDDPEWFCADGERAVTQDG